LPGCATRWERFFEEIRTAAGPRSEIVHNPLTADAYETPDGEVYVRSAITLLRKDGQPMEIAEVQDSRDEFQRLGRVMYALMNDTVRASGLLPVP
jgi:hypothetical protein